MGDVGDTFNALRKVRQDKRASNRTSSADLLTAAGIKFEDKNLGAHLIIDCTPIVDFWPGTGLWKVRGNPKQHRGVRSLLNHLKGKP